MKWKKLGLMFCPNGEYVWMHSHASNPVADHIDGDLFRIYFSTRDKDKRSSVGWVEIDLRAPDKILAVSSEPVIAPGQLGTFDDSGCSIGCVVRKGNERWLYYMGWNLGVTVPWRNTIGLAISRDGGRQYDKVSRAPLLDRSHDDPYTLSYPWVLHDGNEWRMWYGSNLEWGATQADMFHVIKQASSMDGLSWQRDGRTVIDAQHDSEYAFARPCVVRDQDCYRMWYAYRGESYRIGYAESLDGQHWQRKDADVGIDINAKSWDSDSIEYPCIFDHNGQRYMLYCGNGYGQTGFGLAIQEKV